MKIKEMEERSGMTRANIRFYESLELLNPKRDSNGYREYSEQDLEILKKIKLLRLLEMPLDEIKALHRGEQNLLTTLDQHIKILEQKQIDLEKSKNICETMRNDRVSYQTLDAQYYLDSFCNMRTTEKKVLSNDTLPIVYAPWRRYFARSLDLAIYFVVWFIFAELVLKINLISDDPLLNLVSSWAMPLVLTLFIEPLLLCSIGTTPGKWILGLSIQNSDYNKLTYSEAFTRTRTLIFRGLGCNLPLYRQYRLLRNYLSCSHKQFLDWEYRHVLILKDNHLWRAFAYIICYPLLHGLIVITLIMFSFQASMPKHSGDITVQEFCENFNQLADRSGIFEGVDLQPDGTWKNINSNTRYPISVDDDRPQFIFEEENGILKSVTISEEYVSTIEDTENSTFDIVPDYETEIIYSIYAFVKAQKESTLFSNKAEEIIAKLAEWKDFSMNVYGISICFDIEKEGYDYTGQMFIDHGNAKNPFKIHFTMSKE